MHARTGRDCHSCPVCALRRTAVRPRQRCSSGEPRRVDPGTQ